MKKESRKDFRFAIGMLVGFLLWTAAVSCVDVQQIGPEGSAVGFARLNGLVHNLTGVHMALYTVTDLLSLVPFGFVFGFGLLGLSQWIRRKRLWLVDSDILVLGIFYAAVLAVYGFFEVAIVNYRPVLIDGILEASYPSSTTMLVMCVMPTAAMQLNTRIRHRVFKRCAASGITAFTVVMVVCRLVSGVHWFSDIVGGALLSAGLVLLYRAMIRLKLNRTK